ncbi:hypothetical protein PAPYR_4364 [Paratrimastix pyriformis]|uniref:Uncharacterized protein n=1 Tax=Paratrimastix pyriformis TaxID=342808 RepID=A0ABQ8UK78_9EUKA|nr:hypothetical protein PAPYR_4364 [Paratrimastix pyriformis]
MQTSFRTAVNSRVPAERTFLCKRCQARAQYHPPVIKKLIGGEHLFGTAAYLTCPQCLQSSEDNACVSLGELGNVKEDPLSCDAYTNPPQIT